jgi:HlyD family secretion protein
MGSLSRLPASEERVIRDTAAQDVPVDPARGNAKRNRVLAGAAIALIVLGVLGVALIREWSTSELTVPRGRVRIAEVRQGQFIRDVAAEGTIVAADRPTLFSPASGSISFKVRAGDKVGKGQVLALIESPALKNEHQREQATLEGMNVALEKQNIEIRRQMLANRQASDLAGVQIKAAERELNRAKSAWESGAIAERDYAKAQDDVHTARLAHDHALATGTLQDESLQFEIKTQRLQRDRQQLTVENLARRVGELTIVSPVDGVVGNVAVNQQAAVTENMPLLTVVDLSAFEIEFQVAESYANELRIDMTSDVTYGGKTYKGIVTAISPEVRQNEVSGRVRFAEDPPPGLRQNQRVSLRIVMDSRPEVLKVERGGFTDAGSIAYVVNEDTATRREIAIGSMSVGEVEILSGLAPGERIIVSGTSDFNDAPVVRLVD